MLHMLLSINLLLLLINMLLSINLLLLLLDLLLLINMLLSINLANTAAWMPAANSAPTKFTSHTQPQPAAEPAAMPVARLSRQIAPWYFTAAALPLLGTAPPCSAWTKPHHTPHPAARLVAHVLCRQ